MKKAAAKKSPKIIEPELKIKTEKSTDDSQSVLSDKAIEKAEDDL